MANRQKVGKSRAFSDVIAPSLSDLRHQAIKVALQRCATASNAEAAQGWANVAVTLAGAGIP